MSAIISVTLRNNVVSKSVTVPATTPIREVFESNNVEYTSGVVSLDGASLPAGSMDKSLEELGVTSDHCYLMVTVKADNAADEDVEIAETPDFPVGSSAKIIIVGNTVHVISSQKLEDVKLLAKFRPDALSLKEGSGANEREIFHIFTGGRDGGSIANNGVIFGKATTKDGNAMVTLTAPDGTEDMQTWAEEEIGVGILLLKKTEAQFDAALAEVKEEKAAIAASITIS